MDIPLRSLPYWFRRLARESMPILASAREDFLFLHGMARKLAPHVEDGLVFSEKDVQGLVNKYLVNFYELSSRDDAKKFFGDFLYEHAKEIKPDGLEILAQAKGVSLQDLYEEATKAKKFKAGNALGGFRNAGAAFTHTLTFKPGLDGSRSLLAGGVAWGGVGLLAHAVFRSSDTNYVDDENRVHNTPLSTLLEGGVGLGALCGALKIAEKNIPRIK